MLQTATSQPSDVETFMAHNPMVECSPMHAWITETCCTASQEKAMRAAKYVMRYGAQYHKVYEVVPALQEDQLTRLAYCALCPRCTGRTSKVLQTARSQLLSMVKECAGRMENACRPSYTLDEMRYRARHRWRKKHGTKPENYKRRRD